MDIKLAELLSLNGGRLPKYITKDSYPVYYVTKQGVILCPYCANLILLENSRMFGNKIKADDLDDYRINWDNYDLVCERGHKIDSATIELDVPIGERWRNNENKRQIPNKIGHIKLRINGKQASPRH
jgi:hypothetical protein